MSKRAYKLNILGREMQVVSDAEPRHIEEVEALLIERVADASHAGGSTSTYQALMLTALSLADELIAERRRMRRIREKIRTRSDQLLQRLNNHFAA